MSDSMGPANLLLIDTYQNHLGQILKNHTALWFKNFFPCNNCLICLDRQKTEINGVDIIEQMQLFQKHLLH